MNLTMRDSVSLAADVLDNSKFLNNKVCISIFPGTPSIFPVYEVIKGSGIHVGAQNVYAEVFGSFTGETSIPMIEEACDYLLVGHSERRRLFRETNANINRKIATIIESGKKAVLCIGEEELNQNSNGFYDEMVQKIGSATAGISGISSNNLMLAYEPVWAIGSGIAAEVSMVKERNLIISHILEEISGIDHSPMNPYMVFYGGSVDHTNAADYVLEGKVSGLLVGSASLKAQDFKGVISSLIN